MFDNRICKETIDGVLFYSIREVFYNDDKEIVGTSYLIDPDSKEFDRCLYACDYDDEQSNIDSLRNEYILHMTAFLKPIIDLDTQEFAEWRSLYDE